jgi:hypothetical protein
MAILLKNAENACTKYLLDTKMEYVLIYVRMKMGMYLVITQSYATAANYSTWTREKSSSDRTSAAKSITHRSRKHSTGMTACLWYTMKEVKCVDWYKIYRNRKE